MPQYSVLMFSEDLHVCRRLGWYLAYKGCQVLKATTGRSLAEAMHFRDLDLILAQIDREDQERLKVLEKARRLHPRAPMILLSATRDLPFPWECYELDVDDYLFLDSRPAELWRRVAACLARLPEKRKIFGGISQSRPLSRAMVEKVEQVCQYFDYTLDSSRLILQSLINLPEADRERQWLPKIQEVAARLEIMQEMMQGLQYKISGQRLPRQSLRVLQ
jgi:DNA-binding response OmpR family regulator